MGSGETKNRSEAELDEVKIIRFLCMIPNIHIILFKLRNYFIFDNLKRIITLK